MDRFDDNHMEITPVFSDRFSNPEVTPTCSPDLKSSHTFDTQIGSTYNVSKAIAEQWKYIKDNVTGTTVKINDEPQTSLNFIADPQEQITDNNNSITTIETNIDEIETNLTETNNNVTTNRNNISSNTSRLDTHDTMISDIDDELNTQQQSINNLSTTSQNHTQSINTLTTNVTENTNSINTINEVLNALMPVGYIMIVRNNIDYTNYRGFVWQKLPADKVLWSASSVGTITEDTIEAGLPNIKGSFLIRFGSNKIGAVALSRTPGPFNYNEHYPNQAAWSNTLQRSTEGNIPSEIGFDASTGEVHGSTWRNDVYGKSDTVQPPAIKAVFWQRIG